jgi:hypothetical protein
MQSNIIELYNRSYYNFLNDFADGFEMEYMTNLTFYFGDVSEGAARRLATTFLGLTDE